MWHTMELINIFNKTKEEFGYKIFKDRKSCVALCNDLLADYPLEKSILIVLFQ